MGFWEGEHCEYCNGEIVEKKVELHRKHNKKHFLIEDVPAGVCTECGTRYYSANVLKTIQQTILSVEEVASDQEASVGEVLAEAIRAYLWQQDRRKISEESKVYCQRHPELKTRYLGEFITMHKGKVVDHDLDFKILYKRIRQHFGRTPVMIKKVEESPEQVLVRRVFQVKRLKSSLQ